jgi:phage antirepressor YoqD-like protein
MENMIKIWRIKMNLNLTDKDKNKINIGDIVKDENLEDNNLRYYLYDKGMLYRYDEYGEIDEKGFFNIKVDGGLTLVNTDVRIWTKLGNAQETYTKLFKSK